MSTSKKNLYYILDLLPGASSLEILHAYNRAKLTYGAGSLASYSLMEESEQEALLSEVEHAYSILGSSRKRKEYDLSQGFEASSDGYEEDFLEPRSIPVVQETVSQSDKKRTMMAESKVKARFQVLAGAKDKALDVNPEFESKMASVTELTGEFIGAVRVYKGYSEEELARLTRLSPQMIHAIEQEAADALHHPVYLRGHIQLISESLGLPNPRELAVSYINRLRDSGKLASQSNRL